MTPETTIDAAVALIRSADGILITAGAGMGVDSGLPDFRGNEGFWNAYPALRSAGIPFHEIANPASFHDQPRRGWGFYGHRLQLYRDTLPHEGFAILLALADSKPNACFVYTSNVDGQFQQAGYAPERIVECHGSIHHFQCLSRCSDELWPADARIAAVDPATGLMSEPLPHCPRCGGLARPNILMFNDSEWISDRADRQLARFEAWRGSVDRMVVIEVGAGVDIPSVRRMSERQGAPLVRINPRAPVVARGHGVGLPLRALEALRAIDALWTPS
ncbi:MAG: Sir2 family NAD-dependent protein deacetylase [Pseudomonadota bacterium]|nr:Sir2 family NAD-dependent protein deacetylase [Pseudomonadota bacterium]